MEKLKLLNNIQSGVTILPNEFIDHYMCKADGEYVKIYLLLYRLINQNAYQGAEQLADLLELTQKDVNRALKYWVKEGLISEELTAVESNKPSISVTVTHTNSRTPSTANLPEDSRNQPAKDSPAVYRMENTPSQAIEERTAPAKKSVTPREMEATIKGTDLEQLRYMVETYIGRTLSSTDLEVFYYISTQLHFSTELLEYLVEHCVTKGKKSIRYMESVAINWYKKNITTVEEARQESIAYTQNVFPIMKAFGISNRNPAPAEMDYIHAWNQMGFDTDILLEACNRTMLATHQASFPYANRILEAWKAAGIRSRKDIETLDQNRRAAKEGASSNMTGSVVIHEGTQKASAQKNRLHRPTTNSFHNFEQRDYDYDDLEAKLQGLRNNSGE